LERAERERAAGERFGLGEALEHGDGFSARPRFGAEQRLGEPQRGAAHALELRERQQRGGGLSALAGGERAPDFLERSERRARCGGERAPERRELLRRS